MESDKTERARLRRDLAGSLGLPPLGGSLEPEARGSFTWDGVTVEKWVWQSEPGSKVPAVLYRPTRPSGPLPAVVLTCGHGESKSCWSIDYTGQLYARLGLACLALDPIGEEERHIRGDMGTRAHDPKEVVERALAAGRPILGKLVFDTMRGLDFLQSRPDIDAGRLGVAGNSLGGAKAGWLLALEPRLKASLVSGWAFGDHMLVSGKLCTTLPNGALRDHCDWGDFLGLAAPDNGVLVLNGDADVIIDRLGDGTAWRQTEAAVAAANRHFAAAASAKEIRCFFEPGGGHRPYQTYPVALEWLHRWLGTPGFSLEQIRALGSVNCGQWCDQNGVELEPLYGTALHCRGATLPDLGIRPLGREQTACLRPAERGMDDFTLEGWLAAVSSL